MFGVSHGFDETVKGMNDVWRDANRHCWTFGCEPWIDVSVCICGWAKMHPINGPRVGGVGSILVGSLCRAAEQGACGDGDSALFDLTIKTFPADTVDEDRFRNGFAFKAVALRFREITRPQGQRPIGIDLAGEVRVKQYSGLSGRIHKGQYSAVICLLCLFIKHDKACYALCFLMMEVDLFMHTTIENAQIYRFPEDFPRSAALTVRVNGVAVPVLQVKAGQLVSFGLKDAVRVELCWKNPPPSVVVRPQQADVQVVETSCGVQFDLSMPTRLCIETGQGKPLYLIAGGWEEMPPEGVTHYFESGHSYEPDALELSSGDSVYLAGGSVLRAPLSICNATGVTVEGNGVIDGTYSPNGATEGVVEGRVRATVLISESRNVSVAGIIVTNSPGWSFPIAASRGVLVDGVNIINDDACDDGIDIAGSENVTVRNSFIATHDDCIAIKAIDYGILRTDARRNVKDILVEGCVLRNGMSGNVIDIGFETQADRIGDIVFRDTDIVGAHGYSAVFSIHNGDRAQVENVLYEDIRIDHYFSLFLDFRVLKSRWSVDVQRGSIRNITLRNIELCRDVFNTPSLISGLSETQPVSNIRFENIVQNGTALKTLEELELFTRRTENITLV